MQINTFTSTIRSTSVLKAMNRKYTKEQYLNLAMKIKKKSLK